METVDNEENEEKSKDLRIRCHPEVRRKFREFVVQRDFENFENALDWLLDHVPTVSKTPVKTFVGTPVPARMR